MATTASAGSIEIAVDEEKGAAGHGGSSPRSPRPVSEALEPLRVEAPPRIIKDRELNTVTDSSSQEPYGYDALYKNSQETSTMPSVDPVDDFDESSFILFDTTQFSVAIDVFIRQFLAHMFFFLAPCILENPRAQGFYDFCDWNLFMFNIGYPIMVFVMIVSFFRTADRNQEILSGAVYMPLILYVQHRLTIAIKYATLSPTEYQRFIYCPNKDLTRLYQRQMQLLTGWMDRDEVVLDFELGVAAARVGARINEIHLVISNPELCPAERNQYHYWNAFLKGKAEVDINMRKVKEMRQLEDSNYAISVFDLCVAMIRAADREYLSMDYFRRYSVRIYNTLNLTIPIALALVFRRDLHLDGWLVVFLVFSTIINYQFGAVVASLLYTAVFDVYRQWRFILGLNELIRTSDVTLSGGTSAAAAAAVASAAAKAQRNNMSSENLEAAMSNPAAESPSREVLPNYAASTIMSIGRENKAKRDTSDLLIRRASIKRTPSKNVDYSAMVVGAGVDSSSTDTNKPFENEDTAGSSASPGIRRRTAAGSVVGLFSGIQEQENDEEEEEEEDEEDRKRRAEVIANTKRNEQRSSARKSGRRRSSTEGRPRRLSSILRFAEMDRQSGTSAEFAEIVSEIKRERARDYQQRMRQLENLTPVSELNAKRSSMVGTGTQSPNSNNNSSSNSSNATPAAAATAAQQAEKDRKLSKYRMSFAGITQLTALHGSPAVIPRIPLMMADNHQNVLAWVYARLVLQHFGRRFRLRIDVYLGGSIGLMVALMVYALVAIFTAEDQLAQFRSAYFLQSLVCITIAMCYLLAILSVGALINRHMGYHSQTLAFYMAQINRRLLVCQYNPDFEEDIPMLKEMRKYISYSMDIVQTSTVMNPFRIFMLEAQPSLTMSVMTTAISFYGIIVSLYLNARDAATDPE